MGPLLTTVTAKDLSGTATGAHLWRLTSDQATVLSRMMSSSVNAFPAAELLKLAGVSTAESVKIGLVIRKFGDKAELPVGYSYSILARDLCVDLA